MKTIVMDTANKYLVVALFEDGNCLDQVQQEGNRKQSEYAIVCLQEMLEKHHLQILDFDEMVITIGPGSYTGVRVALTIAKTIAATSQIKIKTVSSLKALAGMNRAIAILDARSHKLFIGIYDRGQAVEPDHMIAMDQLDEYIKKYKNYHLVGDLDLIGQNEKTPDLANQIYELSQLEDYVEDVDNLVPEYIKEVEAKKLCR